MSALPSGARRRSPALPRVDPVEHPARNGAPAGAARNRDRGSHVKSSVTAGEFRHAEATFKEPRPDELALIVATAAEVGKLLGELSPDDDVDQALAVIFAARSQLDQIERQLVKLALRGGRSWARIGVALGIQGGRATSERFGGVGGTR